MHVFKLKNNRLNNRDINIDQNNRDYDFSHNRAALKEIMHCLGMYQLWQLVTSSSSAL
jgi:hypothetical protein